MTLDEPAQIGRCPICDRPTHPATRPFCSPRCADVDLGRWFGGHYRAPVSPDPEAAETDQSQDRSIE